MTETADRLEPFLLMARSTKGAAAAKIIKDATAAPGVYGYGELLEVSNIKELETSADHSSSFHLLKLFAYGRLADYQANETNLPTLTPTQLSKLKHLTLVSLALDSRSLTYDSLLSALSISTVRDLEDLIIDAMYANIIGGKLNQERGILSVDWVIGRDVSRPQGMEEIQAKLAAWCGNAQNILGSIDQQIAKAKSDAAQIRRSNQYHIDQRDAAYTAKLNSIQGGGTRNRGNPIYNGQLPQSSLMRRVETPLGSTPTSPRSTFETMGDDDEPTSMSKGRKAPQEEVPMKRQKSTQT